MSGEPSSNEQVLRALGLEDEDLLAWNRSGLPREALAQWLTDRVARRPAGARARAVYGAHDVHEDARRAILGELGLGPADRLLEIGCGGGHLLRAALELGATAAGLDHSPEMLDLAGERAPGAELVLAGAEELPFADGAFTAVAMSIVLMFLPEPVAVLAECHRVLAARGRIAIYTSSPALRGTAAAPEPLASHCYFYDDRELSDLARRAGFSGISVLDDDGGQLLAARK